MPTVEVVGTDGLEATVTLTGELGLDAADSLRRCLHELANRGVKRVTLDCFEVLFLGAACRRVLVTEGFAFRATGGELLLRRVPWWVFTELRDTPIVRLMSVMPSRGLTPRPILRRAPSHH